MNPPNNGAMTEATPQKPEFKPSIFALFSSVYKSAIMVTATGCTAPDPSP